jgi:pyruvate kinase
MAKTKIVATIGPACATKAKIGQMIRAGVDVFRFNMKHGSLAWHEEKMVWAREVSKRLGRPVAIMMDLQGPEIRVGELKGSIKLSKGKKLWLGKDIPIDRLEELRGVKAGNRVLVDDGRLVFKVLRQKGHFIEVEAIRGGGLKSRKGVNVPDLSMDLPALVKRDIEALSIS